MTPGERDQQAARCLAAVAQTQIGWASRDRLRKALMWLSRGSHGQRRDWPVILTLGTPWQDNPSIRGIRWRARAAYLEGEPVFGVDYQICRYCRAGWVEEPHTVDHYKRCGLAAAGLAALRAEHPGFTWHTLGNHFPDSEQFWLAVGVGVPGGYQRRELCVHRAPRPPAGGKVPKIPGLTAPARKMKF
jgi:hypothetical protein